MKETILGKLRDLWAIRRRCQQIKGSTKQSAPTANSSLWQNAGTF